MQQRKGDYNTAIPFSFPLLRIYVASQREITLYKVFLSTINNFRYTYCIVPKPRSGALIGMLFFKRCIPFLRFFRFTYNKL